jgi:hypothetical protein
MPNPIAEWAADAQAGCSFSVHVDTADPRFDVVTIRVPVAPDRDPCLRSSVLESAEGYAAAVRTTLYYLTSAAECLDQLAVHDVATTVRAVAAATRRILHREPTP